MDNDQHNQTQVPSRQGAARSAAWNYAGYAYQIAINFGLTAYIVRHISVAEYGLFLLVMSLSATLNLLDLGISGVLVQSYVYALKKGTSEHFNDLISTALVALGGLGTVGTALFCGLALLLPGPFRIPKPLLHEASLIFLIAALVVQVRLPAVALRQAYQAHHRFDRINQLQLIATTIQTILSVYVLYAGYGIVALAVVQLITAVIQFGMFFAGLPLVIPGIRVSLLRFRGKLLGSLMVEGKWAFMANVTGYLVEMATWGILGSFGSMTEVALYGIAFKAPNQLWNLADKGADVLLPVLSEYSAEEDRANLRRVFLKTQQLIFGAVLPFVILGSFFATPLLHLWVGMQYLHASVAMRWLLVGVLAHAVAYSSDLLFYACGKVKRATWISLAGGAATVGGSILLVPHYGAAGMAASFAVSLLVVDCGWFTMEACNLSHTSVRALVKGLVNGLGLPLLVLIAEIALILSLHSVLSPLWTVLAATASGCVYFMLWGVRTALPLYRNRAEFVAE